MDDELKVRLIQKIRQKKLNTEEEQKETEALDDLDEEE